MALTTPITPISKDITAATKAVGSFQKSRTVATKKAELPKVIGDTYQG